MSCGLILGMLLSAACHVMRPVTLDQLRGIGPSQVLVTRADQSVVVVSRPQMLGARLVGFVNGKYEVMPAADVTQVLVQMPAPRRTALLAVGVAVGIGAFTYALTGGGKSGRDQSDWCDNHPTDPECT